MNQKFRLSFFTFLTLFFLAAFLDSVCATLGTQSWIWTMGFKPQTYWTPYVVEGQTAGYLTQFAGTKLAFLTVHNAGHEVSQVTSVC